MEKKNSGRISSIRRIDYLLEFNVKNVVGGLKLLGKGGASRKN